MNEVLRKVATWFKAKKLSLNISNTKYFLFYSSRKRKCMPNILPPLHIDKVPIKREFVTKILQLYIDENISCKYHMNIASTIVCKSIRILYRTRYIVNKFLRKQLYFFLKSYISPSERGAWIINFKDKFTSAKPLLEQINAMTMYEMNMFQTLWFMCLSKNGNTPSAFKHIYTLSSLLVVRTGTYSNFPLIWSDFNSYWFFLNKLLQILISCLKLQLFEISFFQSDFSSPLTEKPFALRKKCLY